MVLTNGGVFATLQGFIRQTDVSEASLRFRSILRRRVVDSHRLDGEAPTCYGIGVVFAVLKIAGVFMSEAIEGALLLDIGARVPPPTPAAPDLPLAAAAPTLGVATLLQLGQHRRRGTCRSSGKEAADNTNNTS